MLLIILFFISINSLFFRNISAEKTMLQNLKYYIDYSNILTLDKIKQLDEKKWIYTDVNMAGYFKGNVWIKFRIDDKKVAKSVGQIAPFFGAYSESFQNFEINPAFSAQIKIFLDALSTLTCIDGTEKNNSLENQTLNQVILKVFGTTTKMDDLLRSNDITALNRAKEGLAQINDYEKEILTSLLKSEYFILSQPHQRDKYALDFSNMEHGILSSFLLTQILNINTYPTHKNGQALEKPEQVVQKNLFNQILQAIANHTCRGYRITSITNISAQLTLMDELEEFARLTRANQNRQFVLESCQTDLCYSEEWLSITFIFDRADLTHLNPEISFKSRCKRFLSLFDIPHLEENVRIRLQYISKLPWNQSIYTLKIAREQAQIWVDDKQQKIGTYLKTSEFAGLELFLEQMRKV